MFNRFLLSHHCNLLEELTLDHSSVTDRGIRFLSGWSGGVRRSIVFNDNSSRLSEALQAESLPGTWKKVLMWLTILFLAFHIFNFSLFLFQPLFPRAGPDVRNFDTSASTAAFQSLIKLSGICFSTTLWFRYYIFHIVDPKLSQSNSLMHHVVRSPFYKWVTLIHSTIKTTYNIHCIQHVTNTL